MTVSFKTRARVLGSLCPILIGLLIFLIFRPSPPGWPEWTAAGVALVITLGIFTELLMLPSHRRLEEAMRKTAQQQAEWDSSQRQWDEIQEKLRQP